MLTPAQAEAGLRVLLRDEAPIKPFRLWTGFTRFGTRQDELEPLASQVGEAHRDSWLSGAGLAL